MEREGSTDRGPGFFRVAHTAEEHTYPDTGSMCAPPAVRFVPERQDRSGEMDGEEAAKLAERCRELRKLAATMKSEPNRRLLLETADKFEELALKILKQDKRR